MATDWGSVRNDAIAAAQGVLTASWGAVSGSATHQIGLLVQTAQYIDENQNTMTPDELTLLMSQQKTALQNVLTAYVAIGIALALNAIAAVIDVILKDVPALVGFV